MIVSKSTREKFINFLEEKCNNSVISNKSLGIMIRAFHVSSPIMILIIVSCASFLWATISLLLLIIIVALYVILGGCTLSMLEERLCNESFILVDPFIELANMEVNYQNRRNFTAWIMIPHTIITILIYYFRFIKKDKIITDIASNVLN